jgi:hypothetical protein
MSNLLTTDEFWSLYTKYNRTKEERVRMNQFIVNGWGCSYSYNFGRNVHFISIGNEHAVLTASDITDEKYQEYTRETKLNEYYDSYYNTHLEQHPYRNRVFENEVGDLNENNLNNSEYLNDNYDAVDIDDIDGKYEELDLICNVDPYSNSRNGKLTQKAEYLSEYIERKLKHTGIHPEFCVPLSYYLCDHDYRVIKGVSFDRQSCNDEHLIFPYNISKILCAWKGKSSPDKYKMYSKKWLLLGEIDSNYETDDNNDKKVKYFYFWSRCTNENFTFMDTITLHICDNYNMLINGAIDVCDRRRLGIPPSRKKKEETKEN